MRIFVLMILCVTLSACGVKPGKVSAPEGAKDVQFPRTYPDQNTDPKA